MAAEIKLRAERRAGEMLGRMEKAKGAAKKGWKTSLDNQRALRDFGISHFQSHRWQSIAALPKKDFEGWKVQELDSREVHEDGKGPSTRSMIFL